MEKQFNDLICEYCKNNFYVNDSPYHAKRRKYCSRKCSNSANAIKKSTGLNRVEYEKNYWAKPENKLRQKVNKENARLKRMLGLGEAYVKSMLNRCKARAKTKGYDFNLDVSDIVIPQKCPILEVELKYVTGRGGSWNSPSIDRIDSCKGYVKGNIQIISKRANIIKNDATFDEIEKVYLFLKDKII